MDCDRSVTFNLCRGSEKVSLSDLCLHPRIVDLGGSLFARGGLLDSIGRRNPVEKVFEEACAELRDVAQRRARYLLPAAAFEDVEDIAADAMVSLVRHWPMPSRVPYGRCCRT